MLVTLLNCGRYRSHPHVRRQPNVKATVLAVHGADLGLEPGSALIDFHEEEDEDMAQDQEHRPFDVLARCSAVHIDLDDGADHDHMVIWAYDKDDPAAVELVFVPEFVSWTFSRDLLHSAAISGAPAGLGDVQIQPGYSAQYGHHLVITIRSREDGQEVREDFVMQRRAAQKFLYETTDLVPLGEEDYTGSIDIALSLLRSVE